MITEETNGWRPIHDNHAIDNMAVAVKFPQPIPVPLFKKALRCAETVASDQGLHNRHVLKQVQVEIGQDGQPMPGVVAPQGLVFNSVAPSGEEQATGASEIEQLICQQSGITYRTWQYVSWQWQLQRFALLLKPILDVLEGNVAWASVRMEYLDRFQFLGEPIQSSVQELLQDRSKWLAPHIFGGAELWHCHTGCYLRPESRARRLLQIYVDALDQPRSKDDQSMARWVNIITAREDFWNEDIDLSFRYELFEDVLNKIHLELKGVLEEIITDKYAKRIYLQG